MVQRGNWTRNEMQELEQKKDVVQDMQSPSCPLCEQVLTVKRKQFLARVFVKQDQFLQHRLDRIARILKKLKANIGKYSITAIFSVRKVKGGLLFLRFAL